MQAPILLSGTSNETLARSIAHRLNQKLGSIEITRFMDNECRVWVKENVTEKQVFVIQSLSMVADQNLVELSLIGQALKNLKASHVTAVIPWMGYSKQDKAFRKGEAVSAELVARFIEIAGFDAVITVELHSENIVPYFRIPLKEISTHDLFAEALGVGKNHHNTVVASPDKGGQSRSERFARAIGLPIVYLDKSRDRESGLVIVTGISQPIKGRDIVIYDDIINTAATANKTSAFLKDHGAKSVQFLATHAVFAGPAVERLAQSPIDKVIVTDTIFIPKEKRFKNLSVISVAPLLSDAIRGTSR